ncbi:hypothetical protein [Listeria valentina]|uniref:hypothetical protein n=1 Tax=Listeria valentina TaxID=2705293 RepID=UPI00142FE03E|nr:hypothetical protein [Listeria valentina]
MDLANEKRTHNLQQLKKQESQVEQELQTLQKRQGEMEWLASDYQSLTYEQMEARELLQEGWQGDTARGYHIYLEEIQEQEQRIWQKEFQLQNEALNEEVNQSKRELIHLEQQQAKLRRELSSYEPN